MVEQHTQDEIGTILTMIKRLETQRLPRLLEIKENVDRGEVLQDFEISFLENVFKEASDNRQHINRFPEYHDVAIKLVQLYEEITRKALENQRAQE